MSGYFSVLAYFRSKDRGDCVQPVNQDLIRYSQFYAKNYTHDDTLRLFYTRGEDISIFLCLMPYMPVYINGVLSHMVYPTVRGLCYLDRLNTLGDSALRHCSTCLTSIKLIVDADKRDRFSDILTNFRLADSSKPLIAIPLFTSLKDFGCNALLVLNLCNNKIYRLNMLEQEDIKSFEKISSSIANYRLIEGTPTIVMSDGECDLLTLMGSTKEERSLWQMSHPELESGELNMVQPGATAAVVLPKIPTRIVSISKDTGYDDLRLYINQDDSDISIDTSTNRRVKIFGDARSRKLSFPLVDRDRLSMEISACVKSYFKSIDIKPVAKFTLETGTIQLIRLSGLDTTVLDVSWGTYVQLRLTKLKDSSIRNIEQTVALGALTLENVKFVNVASLYLSNCAGSNVELHNVTVADLDIDAVAAKYRADFDVYGATTPVFQSLFISCCYRLNYMTLSSGNTCSLGIALNTKTLCQGTTRGIDLDDGLKDLHSLLVYPEDVDMAQIQVNLTNIAPDVKSINLRLEIPVDAFDYFLFSEIAKSWSVAYIYAILLAHVRLEVRPDVKINVTVCPVSSKLTYPEGTDIDVKKYKPLDRSSEDFLGIFDLDDSIYAESMHAKSRVLSQRSDYESWLSSLKFSYSDVSDKVKSYLSWALSVLNAGGNIVSLTVYDVYEEDFDNV